jgi:hypothetical protein
MSENFPISEYYRVDKLLTNLSIGEALVTLLNENGQPTMLCVFHPSVKIFIIIFRAVCMMCTPRSRMNILTSQEIDTLVARSQLVAKYAQTIDRDSAHEILSRQIDMMQQSNGEVKNGKRSSDGKKGLSKRRTTSIPNEISDYDYYKDYGHDGRVAPSDDWQRPIKNTKRTKQNRRNASNQMSTTNVSTLEKFLNSTTSREVGRTAANAFARGILGTLGLNTTRGTRNTSRKTKKKQ